MANLAQIDRIISEVHELEEHDKIIFFRRMGEMFSDFDARENEDITIESAFGLWEGRSVAKDALRKKAWKQA